MDAVKIEYPQEMNQFIEMLSKKTGASIQESEEKVQFAWRLYYQHGCRESALRAEMDPTKKRRVVSLLKKVQKNAEQLHKELTGPKLRGTFQTIMGSDYEEMEKLLCCGMLSIKARFSKAPKGHPAEWGLDYGASILIELYENATNKKASITHKVGAVYSGDIYEIISAWVRLADVTMSSHGINSLFGRARKIMTYCTMDDPEWRAEVEELRKIKSKGQRKNPSKLYCHRHQRQNGEVYFTK